VTDKEYEATKDIILDLLGWGVDPEYLVDFGLSREVIFYVFQELNLRLPSNLNVEGLAKFPPEEVLEAYDRATEPSTPAASHTPSPSVLSAPPSPSTNVLLPGPAVDLRDVSLPRPPRLTSISVSTKDKMPRVSLPSPTTVISPRTSMPHPSLPPKPPPLLSAEAPVFIPVAAASAIPGLPPQAEVIPAASQVGTPAVDLNDIQAQRRRELMARKAAMASLKAAKTPAVSAHVPVVAEAQPAAPSPAAPLVHIPQEAVDDFLSSLLMPAPAMTILSNVPTRMSPEDMDIDNGPPASIPTPALRSPVASFAKVHSILPMSRPASVARSHSISSTSGSGDTRRRTHSPPSTSSARKSTRRPTAADLIDPEPSLHLRDETDGPLKGFAAVGATMRRCVIEFSDDEEENESVPAPTPLWQQPSRSGTPATLAEKEREIELMRQMIAKREQQSRLKKMVSPGSEGPKTFRSWPIRPSDPAARTHLHPSWLTQSLQS
jgi:hypothetical protein